MVQRHAKYATMSAKAFVVLFGEVEPGAYLSSVASASPVVVLAGYNVVIGAIIVERRFLSV